MCWWPAYGGRYFRGLYFGGIDRKWYRWLERWGSRALELRGGIGCLNRLGLARQRFGLPSGGLERGYLALERTAGSPGCRRRRLLRRKRGLAGRRVGSPAQAHFARAVIAASSVERIAQRTPNPVGQRTGRRLCAGWAFVVLHGSSPFCEIARSVSVRAGREPHRGMGSRI